MRAFERGRALARELEQELAVPPLDLAPLLRKLGLETVPWRFGGRIREVVMDGVIGIDERLPESWVRWLTAHAIGHHLLHTGTSLYLESWQWVDRSKAERQAEEFAAGLLLPPGPPAFTGPRLLARRCGIPEAKASYAMGLWREAP